MIRDRVQHLDLCYQELCALAAQRRDRLEQSRRFWNFLWEVAELEGWIKEKEHIFSSLDYGKDLTSVLVLQSKHSAFEDELGARRANLQQVLVEGEKMIQAKHFGSPKVQECMDNIRRQWEQLEELAAFRKQNLQDTQRFFQFQGDADDLKAWLLEAKRQMSSDDVGHDEYTTQRLLKKHNNLRNEAIKNGSTIDTLSKQANALPEELQNTPDIQRRLRDIKDLYMELMSLADVRQKRLDDTMALYTIFSETDACELWMGQKETWLVGLEVPDKLEDLEVVQNRYMEHILLSSSPEIFLYVYRPHFVIDKNLKNHPSEDNNSVPVVVVFCYVFYSTSSLPISRLRILAQDMANMQLRVDDVNKAVKQLEDSRHPRTKEVKDCQTRLNKRCFFKCVVQLKYECYWFSHTLTCPLYHLV